MVNGKIKGGEYERKISKKLSLWISGGKSDYMFWRTSGSGSRQTTRSKKNLKTVGQAGDITYTCSGVSEDFLKVFCLEIKFYKDINIFGIITKSRGGILDFWKQAHEKAIQVKKIPILIVKQNYKPALFISNESFNIIITENFKLESELVVNLHHQKIFIWKLEDILNIDPKRFMMKVSKENCRWKEK